MKKLLLFSGLPGVGKTTLSREVSRLLGSEIVNLDNFKKTDVDPSLVKTEVDSPEVRWSYYEKAIKHSFSLFNKGAQIVIMDEVFHLSSLRARLERLCTEESVHVYWIEIRCSFIVVEERLRSKKREGHILSTEESLNMYKLFEKTFDNFSVDSENHILINNELVEDGFNLKEFVISRVMESESGQPLPRNKLVVT